MVAMFAEKAASKGMSIENMTTSLRIGNTGNREFVIDAMVSSPNMADMDNLESVIRDMSTLKTDLGLSHFDVFVQAGKNK
jgi:glycine cleavage system regulatory protein